MIAAEGVLVDWLGFGFVVLALAAGAAIAASRTHFAACVLVAATSVLAGLALLCFGAGEAALALTLMGVGLGPVILLGAILLTTPAIRAKSPSSPWPVIVAVGVASVVLIWATQDAAAPRAALAQPVGLGVWIVLLVLVTGYVCAGLLGYGERGALEQEFGEPDR